MPDKKLGAPKKEPRAGSPSARKKTGKTPRKVKKKKTRAGGQTWRAKATPISLLLEKATMDQRFGVALNSDVDTGVMVTGVTPGGLCDLAGLKISDAVLSVNGLPVTFAIETTELLRAAAVGTVTLELLRAGAVGALPAEDAGEEVVPAGRLGAAAVADLSDPLPPQAEPAQASGEVDAGQLAAAAELQQAAASFLKRHAGDPEGVKRQYEQSAAAGELQSAATAFLRQRERGEAASELQQAAASFHTKYAEDAEGVKRRHEQSAAAGELQSAATAFFRQREQSAAAGELQQAASGFLARTQAQAAQA